MSKMFKRFLSLALAFAMVLSYVPTNVFATETGEDVHDCNRDIVVVTEPTCTEPGYTTYTCSICNDSITRDEVAATGHAFEEGFCAKCGEADPNYKPEHKCVFVEGKCECGESDPTYAAPHVCEFVEGKCECGATDTENVDVVDEEVNDEKCICETQRCSDAERNHDCPVCANNPRNCKIPHTGCDQNIHELDPLEITGGTCVKDGMGKFKCHWCDYTEERVFPANGLHNFVNGVCTNEGCNATDRTAEYQEKFGRGGVFVIDQPILLTSPLKLTYDVTLVMKNAYITYMGGQQGPNTQAAIQMERGLLNVIFSEGNCGIDGISVAEGAMCFIEGDGQITQWRYNDAFVSIDNVGDLYLSEDFTCSNGWAGYTHDDKVLAEKPVLGDFDCANGKHKMGTDLLRSTWPTCTSAGYIINICHLCLQENVITPPAGHNYKDGVCALCGEAEKVPQNVAKVGNTEYATIDEAIANWSNNTTLTLLADVTLSDVIKLNSTEHHTLDLGTYTMTAASGKNAIEIVACGNGSAERTAITINADANNPGGIDAGNKSVVYYKYADGGISVEDRPIIKINGGVFTGSTSSWGTAGIYVIGTAARKAATINIAGGTFNCSINGSGKSKLLISGGTFNHSVGSQGDSTALRLISGGKFKTLGFMTADSNNTKFWFGTSMANSNVGLYVDSNGYLVVGGPVITQLSHKYPAKASNATKWNSLLQYSSANANGLFYENVEMAKTKHGASNVTVFEPVSSTNPVVNGNVDKEAVIEEIKSNEVLALGNYKPEIPNEVVVLDIELTGITGEAEKTTELVFEVAPKDHAGEKIEAPSSAITFRLPVPSSFAGEYVNVTHDAEPMGIFPIQGSGNGRYVEIESAKFSVFAIEVANPVAKIGDDLYESIQAAVEAAVQMTAGDVTIEILGGTHAENVNITNGAIGNADSRPNITFQPAAGADVVLEGTVTIGYRQQNVAASNWNGEVTFNNITFNHAENGKHSLDIQDVNGITLNNCTVIGDGEYGIGTPSGNSTTKAVFTDCTFKNGAMQVLGQIGAHLQVIRCTMNDFSFNVQGGAAPGMSIEDSVFNMTLTNAHVGESFYAVRTNACPVSITDVKVNVDSTVTGVAADQAKWAIFYARKDSNASWVVSECEVNLTDAAAAQSELLVVKNDAIGEAYTKRITIANLTSTSNNVADLIAKSEGTVQVVTGTTVKEYVNGVWKKPTPTGNLSVAYMSDTAIWGECGGNAYESFEFRVYSDDTYLGKSSLNNINGIIDGDVYVTWSISLNGTVNSDAYWSVDWDKKPTLDLMPTRVEQWVDGKMVAQCDVQMNGPDSINKIVAAVADNDGNIISYVNDFANITAANAGDKIVMFSDVKLSSAATLPAGITLVGNGKHIDGTVTAGGDLTIEGHVKVTAFSAGYYNRTITIGEGACLEVTGTGRVSLAYGNIFNITGSVIDAKTADKSQLQASLIIPGGMSITGGNDAAMNITNAYVKIGSTSTKPGEANGKFTFNFTNSVVEFTNQFTLSEPTSGKTPEFVVNITDSVVTTGTKFIVAAPKTTVNFDNASVTASTYVRNSGTMNLMNGSALTGSTIQFGENGGNNGTVNVDGSVLNISASSTGHAWDGKGTGKINVVNGGTANVDYMKDSEISLDTSSSVTVNQLLGKNSVEIDAKDYDPANAGVISIGVNKDATVDVSLANNGYYVAKVDENGKIVIADRDLVEENGVYLINNIDDLKLFAKKVNDGNDFAGKTVKLAADIDLADEEWTPIGYMGKTFKGTFDGGNKTIKNLKITKTLSNTSANNGIGLFGRTDDPAVIKNLTIENVDITGSLYVGAVVGLGYTGKSIENVTVQGNIAIDAWWYAGVIGGNGYMNLVDNCHVIGNDGSYIKGNAGSYIGGIWGFRGEGNNKITNCSVDNVDISGVDRVGGICGIGHYGNAVSDCKIDDVTVTATDPDATTVGLIVGACQGTASEPTVIKGNEQTESTAQIANGDGNFTTVTNLFGTNIDGTVPVTNHEAEINGTVYETLTEALSVGGEIKLLRDVKGDYTVAEGKTVVLDLNGKDIVAQMHAITNNGTLTINDSVGTANVYTTDVTAQGRATIVNNGNLTINGGWFGDSNNDTTDRNAFNRGNALKNYSEAVINGGYFTNVSNQYIGTDAYAYAINTVGEGYTIINDATVYGDINGLIYSEGITQVNDGSFTLGRPGEENNLWYLAYGNVYIMGGTWNRAFKVPSWNTGNPTFSGEVQVYGGNFNVEFPEDFCADDYGLVKNADGTYDVVATKVAFITKNGRDIKYDTLSKAINAAREGETIVLIANVYETEVLTIDKNIAFDDYYGNRSITFGEDGAFYVTGNHALTLKKLSVTGAKIYGDTVESGATVNGEVITGVKDVPSVVTYDGATGEIELVNPAWAAKIGSDYYMTLKEALANVQDDETITLLKVISEGEIALPTLNNVTIKGEEGSMLKDTTLSARVSPVSLTGLTIENVIFDNSKILVVRWDGTGDFEDWTIKNCTFRNLTGNNGEAPIHFNVGSNYALENLTFVNNTLDNLTGGSKSGIYGQYTGKIVIENNTFNNIAFRPYVIQLTSDDGIADELIVTGNTFSGTAAGRAQALTNNAAGTDKVNLVVNENIFKDITSSQQICYWNFNTKTTTADFSHNYYDIDVEKNPDRFYFNSAAGSVNNLVAMGIYPRYTELKNDGTIDPASEFTPTHGTITYGFTAHDKIWGEARGNATQSLVVNLYDGDAVIASAELKNNIGGILDGDVYVTWNLPFAASNDNYWNVTWAQGYPNAAMTPDKVELIIDGQIVDSNSVQLNAADDLNKIYASATNNGEFLGYYTSVAEAMAAGDTVYILRDVSESIDKINDVTLTTNNPNGVTITNTYTDYTDFNKVVLASGVTLNSPKVYSSGSDSINTINGTIIAGTYYHSSNAKTTVCDGGKIVTTGMIVNRYHTDSEAGIYVYGDGDDSTVEISCADTIGTYSGTFYVKDAVVEGNMMWIDYKKGSTEEADKYSQSKPVFENSIVNITNEFRLYKDATLTMTGSSLNAGKVQVRENATAEVAMDATSVIKATSVENLPGAHINAVKDENDIVSFVYFVAKIGDVFYASLSDALKAVKSGDTLTLLRDITIDEYWDARYTGAKTTVPVTIDGNGHTIKFTNTVYDGGNYMAAFRFEADATVKNLTIDMSEAVSGFAGRFRAISAKADLTVDNCTFIGNGSANNTRAIIFGEGAGAAIAQQDVTIIKSTFIGWRRGISDNENAQDAKSVTVTGNIFEDANVGISAAGTVTFTGNTVQDSCTVSITSYTDLVTVVATGNTMKEHTNTYVSNAVAYDQIQREFRIIAPVAIERTDKTYYFSSLENGLKDAKAGETIDLLEDIEATEVILINKSVTIDGNDHKVTSSANRVFRVNTGNTEVTLNNVNMVSTAVVVYPNDVRGISIDIVDNVKLTLNDSSVDFTDASANDWAYAVNVTGGSNHKLTVSGGTYDGANVINVRGANNTVVVENATLTSTYPNNDLYFGATIWVQQDKNSSVKATGNTFNGTNAIALNVGYTPVTEDNNIDNTTLCVAKIGDVYYTSIQAAIDAAQAGETVKILHSLDLIAPLTVSADKKISLDLNGKTISYESNVAGEAMITNNGELTITGTEGKIVYTYTGAADAAYTKGNYTINNYGTLTVAEGTVENATAAMKHASYAINNMNNGTVNISGGKVINTNNYAIRQYASGNNKNTINVSGGEVSGTRAVWMQAAGSNTADAPEITLNVSGGKLTGTGEPGYKLAVYSYNYGNSVENVAVNVSGGEIDGDIALTGGKNKTSAESVTITGGTITNLYSYAADDVAAESINVSGGTFMNPVAEVYCAENYIPEANADGTYGVKPGKYVARNTTTGQGYETLQDAIDAAKDGDTIALLVDDIKEDVTVVQAPGVAITIDGAGKIFKGTITVDGKSAAYTTAGLTIKNVVFDATAITKDASINLGVSGNTNTRYTSNVTVHNCSFTDNDKSAAAIKSYTGGDKNLTITECTATGMHSLAQLKNVAGVTVGACTIIEGKNGISLGASSKAVINNCEVDVEGYGIRADAAEAGAGAAIIESTIKADTPVVVRNVKAVYDLDLEKNEMTAAAGGYDVKFTTGNDDTCDAPEIAANITGMEGLKVYPAYEAKIGDYYYASFTTALKEAKANDTIDLLADIEETSVILIDKSVTINGNDHKVTSSANRVFRVTTANTEVTLNNVNMVSSAAVIYPSDVRGISVDPSLSNVALTLNNCSVDFTDITTNDWTYAVNVSGNGTGHTITVNGGTYEGANVINVHGANNTVVVKNATLTSLYPNHDEYYGATIWVLQNQSSSVEATGNTFNGNNAIAFNLGTGTALTESNNTDNTTLCVAKIGNVYYTSLAAAVEAAQDDDTILILQSVTGAGAVIDKDITIDFNGKTYSFNVGVGSTGTMSNGFQILEDNTVTLKNGTLKVADEAAKNFYILVQNYADLTVHSMTLDGTNLDKWSKTDGDSYVLSNNSGNVYITGNTTIIANNDGDKAFAFDACKYADYAEPVVTVADTDTVTIKGKVEAAAKIGNVYYATFDQAVKAFNADANSKPITLMAPVVLDKNTTLENLTIDCVEGVYPAFRIQNDAKVTVKDCNITNATDYVFVLGAADASTAGYLTIESGTYTGNTTVASVTKGLLTINDGTFSVTAGEYGATYLLNCVDANYVNGTAKIDVKGGSFVGFNPMNNTAEGANTNFVNTDYLAELDENAANTWSVRVGIFVAKNGNTKYEDLQVAVDEAKTNDIIELLDDCGLVIVEKKLTIQRNGFSAKVAAIMDYTAVQYPDAYVVMLTSEVANNAGMPYAYVDYNNNKIVDGDEVLTTLQYALDTAAADASAGKVVTVRMTADLEVGTIIIPSYVKLDIESKTLTADRVIGLKDSILTANYAANTGKLYVKQSNIQLASGCAKNASGFGILPIWIEDHYEFSQFNVQVTTDKQGLYVYEEDKTIRFVFAHQQSGKYQAELLNGGIDNGIRVELEISWITLDGDGTPHQTFVYSEDMFKTITGGDNNYTFTLTGYDIMSLDLDTMEIVAKVVTDAGATCESSVFTIAKDKAK